MIDFLPKEQTTAEEETVANIVELEAQQQLAHPQNYIQAATSDNTRKAYQSDIRHFLLWGGLLPTTPDEVVRYLHTYAAKLNPRTMERRLIAIKHWHAYQGFADPTAHPAVKKTLTGIKHVHGRPREKAPALYIEQLETIATHLQQQGHLRDYRDNALLQIGFFGAFRCSELVNIQWEHMTFSAEGVEILVPRSKTDQEGEGQTCAIPYGEGTLCPVTALVRWCEKAGIQSGYAFRAIPCNGKMSDRSLHARSVGVILKQLAQRCDLPDAECFSAHSLRRGFATSASKKGAPFGSIKRQGRWRHEGTVLGYIEEAQRFDENAAGFMLKQSNEKP